MNEDTFFYQDEGRTIGPVSGDDLRERIKQGKLRLFDLILREGDSSWRMALEHSEFKSEFKDKSRSALRDRPWVCLQRKSPDGFDFITTGPYSSEEVRESLQGGKVSYSDYVWRSGMAEWKRIGLVEDFNPRLKSSEAAPALPPPIEEPKEILKNVVEMKRARPPIPEPDPDEAVTGDLTAGALDLPPPPPVPLNPTEDLTPVTATPAPRERSSRRRRKNVPWLDWGIVVILMVVLGAVALVLSRNIKRYRTVEAPASTVVETLPPLPANPVSYDSEELESPPPEDTADEDEEVEKPDEKAAPAPVKKVSKAPTELFLAVQNRNNREARVELRTNGTPDFPVYVQVVGQPGHVTSGASYYRYVKLKPSGDPKQPLDLSKIKLPQGRLVFRASTGDLKKEAKLNLGVTDAKFKQTIGRVRKLHAYAIWSERLKLLNLSALLETRIGAASGGKLSTKGLEALNEVRLANGTKFILFDEWWDLKSIFDDARKQPSSSLASKAKRFHDRMAGFSIWK